LGRTTCEEGKDATQAPMHNHTLSLTAKKRSMCEKKVWRKKKNIASWAMYAVTK
jgi:hypothetical protein